MEKLKEEFFKKFGQESFRGYPLEQCHSIWEFFLPHLEPRNADVSGLLLDKPCEYFGGKKGKHDFECSHQFGFGQ